MQTVAIIDYGSGNLRSAQRAMAEAARRAGLDCNIQVTDRADIVAAADRVVLPGVGAFADCRAGLAAVDGMIDAMTHAVENRGRPFLGICVGMQLLATAGLEHGRTLGLGWIKGTVDRLDLSPDTPDGPNLKIPHMGWNTLTLEGPDHPVLAGLADGDFTYFVHSFALRPDDPSDRLAHTTYGRPFAAIVGHGTMVGTQFHPEKSQSVGLRLIANFLGWSP